MKNKDKPYHTLSFHGDNDKEIGLLNWDTGKLAFHGDAKKSAKIFFDFLKPYVDEYIKGQNEKTKGKFLPSVEEIEEIIKGTRYRIYMDDEQNASDRDYAQAIHKRITDKAK